MASIEAVSTQCPSDHAAFAARRLDKWTVSPPGGESYAAVQARVTQGRQTYGGTARALMVALGFETPDSAANRTIEQGAVYVFGAGGLGNYC